MEKEINPPLNKTTKNKTKRAKTKLTRNQLIAITVPLVAAVLTPILAALLNPIGEILIREKTPTNFPSSTTEINILSPVTPSVNEAIAVPSTISNPEPTHPILDENFDYFSFKDGCIPAFWKEKPNEKIWTVFPEEIAPTNDCLPIAVYTPFEEGLHIFSKNQSFIKGLKIKLPEEANRISFSLEINNIFAMSDNSVSRFYYGFFSQENSKKLEGEFIQYQDTLDKKVHFYRTQYPASVNPGAKLYVNNNQDVNICLYYSGSTTPNIDVYMSVFVDEEPLNFADHIKINSKVFIIGVIAPSDGLIDIKIKNFKIHSINVPANPCN